MQAIRLARWLKLAIYGWLLTVFVLLLPAWTWEPKAAQESKAQKDVLRVHQLVVVDEKGIDRIVIGPVPDPQMMGKREKRRAPGTGIQLNDGSGNERAGRSEEHTSELQSRLHLVCRLLLEKKK